MPVQCGIQIALHHVWEFRTLVVFLDRRAKMAEVNVIISGECLDRLRLMFCPIAHEFGRASFVEISYFVEHY